MPRVMGQASAVGSMVGSMDGSPEPRDFTGASMSRHRCRCSAVMTASIFAKYSRAPFVFGQMPVARPRRCLVDRWYAAERRRAGDCLPRRPSLA